jgi:hypothetical protein
MLLGVLLGRMLVMFSRMQPVAMSDLGVMRSLLMRARFVVLCGFAVVLSRFIMVMRGFLVMLVNVVVGHLNLPVLEGSTVAVHDDMLMTPCDGERVHLALQSSPGPAVARRPGNERVASDSSELTPRPLIPARRTTVTILCYRRANAISFPHVGAT